MFTGLIQDIGTLLSVARAGGGTARLSIRTALASERFELGESIALDGSCHTVVSRGAGHFEVDSSPETQARTRFSDWRAGSSLHLERALALGDRLGGHMVQGHVDDVATLLSRREEGGAVALEWALPLPLVALVVAKGSVALDGVSLTVNEAGRDRFTVMLIPETQRRTNLGEKRVGERANLEVDVVGRYVQRLMELKEPNAPKATLDLDLLRRAGFA